jgi:hypothetical protein
VNDVEGGYDYPPEVRFEIEEQNIASYRRAADFLGISDVDVVCVQHEFGIYGGTAGGHLLALLREVDIPIVTTLHTVLKEPNDDQKRVMQELIQLSTRLVVMSQKGAGFLKDVYMAPTDKIDVRLALPQQGCRERAQRPSQNHGGAPRRGLHRFGSHPSAPPARARRVLPHEFGTSGRKERC